MRKKLFKVAEETGKCIRKRGFMPSGINYEHKDKVMKKILLLLVSVLCGLSILCGCHDPYASTPCGDFVYFTRERDGEKVAYLNGLSEQGKQKEVVIVPETVDGYKVVALSDMFGIAEVGELESKNLEALFRKRIE